MTLTIRRLTLPAIAWVAVTLAGCNATAPAKDPGGGRQDPQRTQEVRLIDYSVHHVDLTHAVAIGGREVTEAYLVRLEMELPSARGPVVQLLLGGEPVREYGGWTGGIYFKVYDRAALERLGGKAFAYRLGTKQASLDKVFELPQVESLEKQPERAVLR